MKENEHIEHHFLHKNDGEHHHLHKHDGENHHLHTKIHSIDAHS